MIAVVEVIVVISSCSKSASSSLGIPSCPKTAQDSPSMAQDEVVAGVAGSMTVTHK